MMQNEHKQQELLQERYHTSNVKSVTCEGTEDVFPVLLTMIRSRITTLMIVKDEAGDKMDHP